MKTHHALVLKQSIYAGDLQKKKKTVKNFLIIIQSFQNESSSTSWSQSEASVHAGDLQ